MDLTGRSDDATEVNQSQWNVPVFFWRILIAFGVEQFERADQFGTRHLRLDHFVDKATLGGDVRRCKLLPELAAALGFKLGAFSLRDFAPI